MSANLKQLFSGYLNQLACITEKIPAELYAESLSPGMFSLEMNAKIAANFIFRGYCPLLGQVPIDLMRKESGKAAVLAQIRDSHQQLAILPEVNTFDDTRFIAEQAGTIEVKLCQSRFIYGFIVPNYMFHMGMVYAIARQRGVALSKGDFDGWHVYPAGFSLVGDAVST